MENEIDGLYAVPREEFVAERDKLARRLKRDGDADQSSNVRALRKPTAVAWLANQLARQQASVVEALLAAGSRVRQAQEDAISGGDGGALKEATRELKDTIGVAVKTAATIRGAKPAALADLPGTLTAAATDPEGQGVLRSGRLVDALDPAGFGDVDVDDAVLAQADELRHARERNAAKLAALQQEAAAAEAEADRLAEIADEAEGGARRARRQADAAGMAAEDARRRLEASSP